MGIFLLSREVKEGEASTNTTNRSMTITVASVLFLFGLGVAVATPFILIYIIRNGTGPIAFGIEFLHGSTLIWNLWGFNAGLVLGLALGIVSALEAVAGFWLWRSLIKGGKLGIALLPVDLFFAIGFAIPILYIVPPLRSILLVAGWRSLR